LQGDKNIVLKAVINDGRVIKHANGEALNCPKVIVSAIKSKNPFPDAYKLAGPNAKNDELVLMEAIKHNVVDQSKLNPDIKEDKNIQ
jgi:hypothetical protein